VSSSSSSSSAPTNRAQEIRELQRRRDEGDRRLAELEAEVSFGSGTKDLDAHLAAIRLDTGDSLADFESLFPTVEYDSAQLLDKDFWESGVPLPAEPNRPSGSGGPNATEMYKLCLLWKRAFEELDVKFGQRALLAYQMKIAYKQQRQKFKSLTELHSDVMEQLEKKELAINSSYAESKKIVENAKVTMKPCGCKKKCVHSSCGCKSRQEGCSKACGCQLSCCMNDYSYSNNAEGREKLRMLELGEIQRAEDALAEKKERLQRA
jgi:hypothetical protein